jgi:RNA polymerase sigma-70 factor (ECF subfamily)
MKRSTQWKDLVTRLYDGHFRVLLRRAHRSLRDKNRAADLVQQLFVRMLEKERSFASEDEAEKFLYASFHNLLVDHIRTEVRWKYQDLDGDTAEPLSTRAHQEDDLVRKRLGERELPLPGRQKRVFEMAYIEGRSDAEIAEQLGMNIHTLQRSLVNSRRILERIMVSKHDYTKSELKTLFTRRRG